MSRKIQVKAGRFVFDKESKKVKMSKEKGLLSIYKNEQEETYFSWASLQDNVQHINLMVFPNDAVFEPLLNKNNTYVLRAETDDDRYFFWFQEKVNVDKVVKDINDLINSMEHLQQKQPMDIQQQNPKKDQKPQPMDVQNPSQTTNKPGAISDFITRMQKNLQNANQNRGKSITHLNEIANSTAVNMTLTQTTEAEKKQLAQFLPETQQEPQFLNQNLRSPQFLQALDVLSDALNSENAIALFMEMGLDQKYLQRYYGVQAFIRALEDWGTKQPKQQQQPNQEQ